MSDKEFFEMIAEQRHELQNESLRVFLWPNLKSQLFVNENIRWQMKKYKSSDLTKNRAEVLAEAAKNGVIIQQLETNGKVRREFVLFQKSELDELLSEIDWCVTTNNGHL